MLWLKAFHIIFVVTWFAGLFYLPRIFVSHAMAKDPNVTATFKVMERKLLIMTHLGGGLSWLFGIALLSMLPQWLNQGWMQAKLALVLLLSAYHFYCMLIVRQFAHDDVRHHHTWYRWFNEFPTIVLIATVMLVELKPF